MSMCEKIKYWVKTKKSIIVLSLLLTIMQLTGCYISIKYQTSVHTFKIFRQLGTLACWQYFLVGAAEFLMWNLVLSRLFIYLQNHPKPGKWKGEIRTWLAAPALFLCWLPSFWACYPGFFNYDAIGQLPQAMYEEVPYSTHHPLLHTLIMGKLMKAGYVISGGNMQIGLLFYSVFQMGVCAIVFCILIRYIWRLTNKRWLAILAFCYYAFFPVIVMFAMSTTKDVLFSLVLQLCVMQIYEMYQNTDIFWKNILRPGRLVISIVVMCLLRNNGIYAVLLLAVCSLIFLGLSWKRNLVLYGCALVLYMTSSGGIRFLLDAESGSRAEAFCVPMQQIARVYSEYGEEAFDGEELSLLYRAISEDSLNGYSPVQADQIKNYTDFDAVWSDKWSYLKLYLRMGLRYPGAYLMSFLDNTYQTWYPWTSIVDDTDTGHIYYFDYEMKGAYLEREPHLEWLYRFYVKIASQFSYQKIPIVRLLFSIGAMFWVTMTAWFFGIYEKNKGVAWSLLLVLLYCLTSMLGPVSLVRYYLILFYGFPICIAFFAAGGYQKMSDLPI